MLCRIVKYTAIAFGILTSAVAYADDVIGILPEVTVVDDYYVDFDNWGGYDPFFDPVQQQADAILAAVEEYAGSAQEAATLAAISNVFAATSVCRALVSSGARWTVSTSDVTTRWLAAQEVFNAMNNSGLLEGYREFTRSLTFIVDGKKYRGFKVAYADGVKETWAVLPNYATSSIKLLDQPLPNSREEYAGDVHAPKCNGS